jgi:hypothetical protein
VKGAHSDASMLSGERGKRKKKVTMNMQPSPKNKRFIEDMAEASKALIEIERRARVPFTVSNVDWSKCQEILVDVSHKTSDISFEEAEIECTPENREDQYYHLYNGPPTFLYRVTYFIGEGEPIITPWIETTDHMVVMRNP